jgi:hypothetical protein
MRSFHFALASLLLLLLAVPARADLPPPDTEGCRMASAGDPCDLDGQPSDGGMKVGVCRKATCSRIDYGHWDRDASAAPPTMEYECLRCVVGTDAGTDAASATGGAGGTSPGTGGAATGGSGGAATGGSGGAATGGAPAKSDSGCAVSGQGAAFGPWLLGGCFAAVVLFARRRRR